MVQLLNLELADTMGNLLNRCSSKGVNPHQTIPSPPPGHEEECPLLEDLGTQLASLRGRVGSCYEEFHFYQGCVLIMAALRTTNQAVQAHQPWRLRAAGDEAKLRWLLAHCFDSLRISGILLQPVVPRLAARLLGKLGVGAGHAFRH